MLTANEIRQSFKDFFETHQHTVVPSAPMVIKDDPTLMFTNAGMNQWKDIILGTRDPEPRRRADSQKCLRVSGKHNDLEEVGHDTYHHTMFEMLGNWSFGDYFKEGAIDLAWEYLVDVLHLPAADLYVTVFEGAPAEGVSRDNEAANHWKKHIPADHILDGNKHDNFWEMGDTGPCGPCSEIHLDFRSEEEKAAVSGRELVNKDHPQVIEIWNLVFMQYNRKADGSLEKLGMNVIDTGMGLERLVRAIQGKHSNYDTDIFTPYFREMQRLTGLPYVTDKEDADLPKQQQEVNVAMRVVADHLRAVAFAIADGQLPSNAKAGYVIRRILRRAVRYAYTFLNQKESFMHLLVPTLVHEMGDAYPELNSQQTLITKVIKEEEEAFLRTLDKGIALLNEETAALKAAGTTTLDGNKAFKLFDTYGFPLDLTELILREQGFDVDTAQFDAAMQEQKQRARNAAQVENSDWTVFGEAEQQFVGYDLDESPVHVMRYRQVIQKKNTYYELVFDQTPFYGEMGGQVGDSGTLTAPDGTVTPVIDTKRENGISVHIVNKLPLQMNGITFQARVDTDKREASKANHTATHLLHYALRQVLGNHVEQKGSYVSSNTLRFDFSHFQKITPEELREVERLVNRLVRRDIPLDEHRDTPIEEATNKYGAVALFGEKYGDRVRVVRFGDSCELCGGLHASSTGRIGLFKIVSESSVAAGIRRIEAKTAEECEQLIYNFEDTLSAISTLFNNAKDLDGVIRKYIDEHDNMKKEIESFHAQTVERLRQQLVDKAEVRNGITVIATTLFLEPATVKDLAFKIRQTVGEKVICAIGSVHQDKPMLTVIISEDVVKDHGWHAGNIVREAAKLIQGGGGGQPHFATAGGKNADALPAATQKVIELAFATT